ncbi:unnamed protein product [Protopolystoma xenopodis]|uniref:Uncharacterized protein n=1 Tax=Protopolystoma xenopodis TaxID=117903 RepID=A0A3S5CS61_9PLAT|nr:unnamed protein product [Protopolystoma xenopodis]
MPGCRLNIRKDCYSSFAADGFPRRSQLRILHLERVLVLRDATSCWLALTCDLGQTLACLEARVDALASSLSTCRLRTDKAH